MCPYSKTTPFFVNPNLACDSQGTGEYGASALADLSEEEFRANYLGLDRSKDDPDIHWPPADIPDVELPREWDWRTQGAVTPVKNQVSS